MPGQPIPGELKEKGLIWLLPPYCWSHRQIARKLKIILTQNLCSGLSNIVPGGLRTVFALLMMLEYG